MKRTKSPSAFTLLVGENNSSAAAAAAMLVAVMLASGSDATCVCEQIGVEQTQVNDVEIWCAHTAHGKSFIAANQ